MNRTQPADSKRTRPFVLRRWSFVTRSAIASRRRRELAFFLSVLAAIGAAIAVVLPAAAQTAVITEFMAVNQGALLDEDGQSSDWIEIFNPSQVPVNLGGWYLTDSASNPTKWRFPGVSLGPGEFLVVFASGRNRTNATGRLHTNFALSEGGEYLGLVQPDGVSVTTQFAPVYPGQRGNISFGSLMDGNTILPGSPVALYPTPGQANPSDSASSGAGSVFMPPSQPFFQPFYLSMGSQFRTNVTIRYELVTGAQTALTATNVPTELSPAYGGPIWINRPMQVRARAFSNIPGIPPGPVTTESYFPLHTNVTAFRSTLPLVVIHTISPSGFSEVMPQSVIFSVFGPRYGYTSLSTTPDWIGRAGVRRFAADVQSQRMHFSVELWDENNSDRDAELLGLPVDSDWVLRAISELDPTLISDPLGFGLSRATGRYAPRTRFVELFLSGTNVSYPNPGGTNAAGAGSYQGIYVLEERVKRGMDRVAIDRLPPAVVGGPDITGGYLVKVDRAGDGDFTFSAGGTSLIALDPDPLPAPQLDYIRSYLDRFQSALTNPGYMAFTGTNHYSHYLDADAAVDYHLANVLCLNPDAFFLNGYLVKPRLGRITMGPIWDLDRAFTSLDERSGDPGIWGPLASGSADYFRKPYWWARLFSDPDFFQRWIDRYQELRATNWSSVRILATIERLADEVREAHARNQARWGGLRTSPSPLDGTYQGEINNLKQWMTRRLTFLDTQFLAQPIITATSNGSIVDVVLYDQSRWGGTRIYYTLDGSDPRASQSRTNPAAQLYSGPFRIDTSARVVARAINDTVFQGNLSGGFPNPPMKSFWSGPARATIASRPPMLRMTEVMYHPMKPAAGGVFSMEDYQFIEFRNMGTVDIPLGGIRFVDGIEFTFPSMTLASGQYAVAVRNRAAFGERYGTNRPVIGEFSGTLALGGERLTLADVAGQVFLDFAYSDQWHDLTDGPGLSLVAVNESASNEALGRRSGWRPSALLHGTPGRAEPTGLPVVPVLVNEVLSNPLPPFEDAVELLNPTAVDADISFWFLTDDFDQPRKFRVPIGTILSPGGYLAFDEHSFNPFADPPRPTSFAFNPGGDSVYLYSASESGDLTGYVHGFRFGAARTNEAIGRITDAGADGMDRFAAQAEMTIGGVNSQSVAAAVGSNPTVAITEIMHDPRALAGRTNTAPDLEFIEIKNIGPVAIDLGGAILTGGIEFEFPVHILDPGAYGVIVRNRSAFASLYGTNLPVIGEFQGGLASEGERLVLTGAYGEPVLDFVYPGESFPFSQGAGFSLVLVDEQSSPGGYSFSAAWRTSGREGGSPGAFDPPPNWTRVQVNELRYVPLQNALEIELFNPSTNAVDVSGWLFENRNGSLQVNIAAPGLIPPGGYFVNWFPMPIGSYGPIHLISRDPVTQRPSGYRETVTLPSPLRKEPYGPVWTSDGRREFVPLTAWTPGASNAPPRVGPLIITEIHYHPPDGVVGVTTFDNDFDEFVEIQNVSGTPVSLQNLYGASFPTGAVLSAGGIALLINSTVQNEARFRATYAIPASVWLGNTWYPLGNSAGFVALGAGAFGLLTGDQVDFDQVEYADTAPWPVLADGWGPSLQRIDTRAIGNDPANWRAAWPSPGRTPGAGPAPVIRTQPRSVVAAVGALAEFRVSTDMNLTLAYRWLQDGLPVTGGTGAVLRIESVRLQDAGNYRAIVYSSSGVAASDPARLDVVINNLIIRQPTNASVRIRPDPAAAPATNAAFSITASSHYPPVRFQWQFNDHEIPGAVAPTLVVSNVSLADEGVYRCRVSDETTTVLSQGARLTPLIAPVIIQPPLEQRVVTGAAFTVSAAITGHPPPFEFEWRRASTPIGTNLTSEPIGAWTFNAPTNLVTNQPYRVVVRNAASFAPGVSVPFNVTTLVDSDGDGLPDEFENTNGLGPLEPADALLDSDGDGMTNAAEYIAGTDPRDAASYLRIDWPADSGPSVGAGPSVSFLAVSNRTYTVEARDTADTWLWRPVGSVVATATNRVVSIADPLPASSNSTLRVYRLVTPRRPGSDANGN